MGLNPVWDMTAKPPKVTDILIEWVCQLAFARRADRFDFSLAHVPVS